MMTDVVGYVLARFCERPATETRKAIWRPGGAVLFVVRWFFLPVFYRGFCLMCVFPFFFWKKHGCSEGVFLGVLSLELVPGVS